MLFQRVLQNTFDFRCVLVVVQPIPDISRLDEAQKSFIEINTRSSADEGGIYFAIAHNYQGYVYSQITI